nr:hypothetical protein [Apis mellifera nudivirus]
MAIQLRELIELVMSDTRVRLFMNKHGINTHRYMQMLNDLGPIEIETFDDFQREYDRILIEYKDRLSLLEQRVLRDERPIINALVLEIFNKIV